MIVTEKKFIKIDRECKVNPVFLTWTNTNGGREYWLFHKVQTIAIDTKESGDFEPYVADLETTRGQVFDITNEATPKIIIGTNAEIEDIEGLKTLLYSPSVEWLRNPETWETEGCEWVTVRPQKGSFKLYDTNEVRNVIEITIELPYIYNQQR